MARSRPALSFSTARVLVAPAATTQRKCWTWRSGSRPRQLGSGREVEPAAQPCPCFSRRFLPWRCRRLRGATVLDEPDYVNALISRCSAMYRLFRADIVRVSAGGLHSFAPEPLAPNELACPRHPDPRGRLRATDLRSCNPHDRGAPRLFKRMAVGGWRGRRPSDAAARYIS